MAIGKWISSLKDLFNEGPMKQLTEEVADKPQGGGRLYRYEGY